MDAFDKLARAFFANLDDAGATIPKQCREDLLERLAIQGRQAAMQARRETCLSPQASQEELQAELTFYQHELARRQAAQALEDY